MIYGKPSWYLDVEQLKQFEGYQQYKIRNGRHRIQAKWLVRWLPLKIISITIFNNNSCMKIYIIVLLAPSINKYGWLKLKGLFLWND